jgi:hypothetical protein
MTEQQDRLVCKDQQVSERPDLQVHKVLPVMMVQQDRQVLKVLLVCEDLQETMELQGHKERQEMMAQRDRQARKDQQVSE